ncbi:DUF5106 domain-containing protein [Bacteroides caecigallinarum]|uniref:DUF5106 domain-containing protein n=1 Tax=Bacteroides caecigallinarum TaxID=1411144 RepID=UPI0021D4545B|nr:DUF5106 domain-containing protein [Bacteroides caecigallinarum]
MLSCGRHSKKTEMAEKKADATENVGKTGYEASFPMPEVPLMVNSEEDAKAYIMAHFWDGFRFGDTLLLGNKNVISRGISDFIRMSSSMTDSRGEDIRHGFQVLCKGITEYKGLTDSLKYYVEEFLYNPNSPYYNEVLYGIYLKEMIATLPVDDPMVSAYDFKLKLISRNCVGNRAEDFYYFLPDGTKKSFYSTKTRGQYTILVFYDPECHSCHDIMMGMFADKELHDAVDKKWVTVVAIYTDGDSEVWKKYLKGMPENWIIGDDRMAIKDNALYDLKAMPTLYLLDKDKNVVLKDMPYNVIRKKIFNPTF